MLKGADFWLGFLQIIQLEKIRTVMHFLPAAKRLGLWLLGFLALWTFGLGLTFTFIHRWGDKL